MFQVSGFYCNPARVNSLAKSGVVPGHVLGRHKTEMDGPMILKANKADFFCTRPAPRTL